MEQRQFGSFGPVSVLTLGGGGIGQLWGATTREEAVSTVREAADLGISFFDLAPSYGNGEAESVFGEAFGGQLPSGALVTTKCRLHSPPPAEVRSRLEQNLTESLRRLRLERVDLYFIHNYVAEAGTPLDPAGRFAPTSRTLLNEVVRPEMERLMQRGLIGGWGLTGIGIPDTLLDVLRQDPAPSAIQCITNVLDSPGGLQGYEGDARPREIIAAAVERGVPVMGIRAVQAGALTDAIDRSLPDDHPEVRDYQRAAPFRELARSLGTSPAALAHRYALAMPGVPTVVLGVKNRAELRECVAAAEAGPLSVETIAAIDRLYGR